MAVVGCMHTGCARKPSAAIFTSRQEKTLTFTGFANCKVPFAVVSMIFRSEPKYKT